jgi:hypothetical protein
MNCLKSISVPKSAQLVIDRFRARCTAGLLPMLATAHKRGIVRKSAWCCTWYVLWALEEPKLKELGLTDRIGEGRWPVSSE